MQALECTRGGGDEAPPEDGAVLKLTVEVEESAHTSKLMFQTSNI